MFKDLFRRKEIIASATAIAREIISRYPPSLDEISPIRSKADIRKKHKKLIRALQVGKREINRTISEMGLGVYGKATFYQTIQETMLDEGYDEKSARVIMEELVVPFR